MRLDHVLDVLGRAKVFRVRHACLEEEADEGVFHDLGKGLVLLDLGEVRVVALGGCYPGVWVLAGRWRGMVIGKKDGGGRMGRRE
jgi:hypothetical protein